MPSALLLLGLALAAGACAPNHHSPVGPGAVAYDDDEAGDSAGDEVDDVAPDDALDVAPDDALDVAPDVAATGLDLTDGSVADESGTIPRPALTAVLDRGPGRFLVGIEVEPVFASERFAGWRVRRFQPADPSLGRAPVRPGDVIRKVNGRPIARPEQFQAVWDGLRAADELVIVGERLGQPLLLRYQIE